MIAVLDILLAAVFGVAVATLFEGRWGPILIATPLFGLVQGAFLLIPADALVAMGLAGPWLALATQLSDYWLLIAAMVACATGSVLTAAMLGHSRQFRDTGAFWLPDMDRPAAGGHARAPDLSARVGRFAPDRTRKLVEEGYEASELQPTFQAAPAKTLTVEPRVAAGQAAPVPPEATKRREPRRRTLLAGRLCADGGVSVPCVIQNLSSTGASVRLQSELMLPRLVSLIDLTNGVGHKAQVRWRFREGIGLKFLTSYDLTAPRDEEAAHLARQWASLRA
jgi:hypothetical protein